MSLKVQRKPEGRSKPKVVKQMKERMKMRMMILISVTTLMMTKNLMMAILMLEMMKVTTNWRMSVLLKKIRINRAQIESRSLRKLLTRRIRLIAAALMRKPLQLRTQGRCSRDKTPRSQRLERARNQNKIRKTKMRMTVG